MGNKDLTDELTQEQVNKAIIKMLDGKSAEIFTSMDHETGKVQIIYKVLNPAAAVFMLSQVIASMSRNGISNDIIRNALEIGLNHRQWNGGKP